MATSMSMEELKVLFAQFDKDGSGKISFRDMEQHWGTWSSASDRKRFFDSGDLDSSGEIDFEEFVKMVQANTNTNPDAEPYFLRGFYAPYGTIVTNVDHNQGPSVAGMYAHFSALSWASQIMEAHSWVDGGNHVAQVRNNEIIWSGMMELWQRPNSPTWGKTNSLVGHARRLSGAAPGQWEAGDLMFNVDHDAKNPGPGTYPGHRGTLVTHIDHNFGDSYAGQYPHFSAYSWSAQVGTTSWDQKTYDVYQVRNTGTSDGKNYWKVIWNGNMTFIQNPNGPNWGTTNKAIGHAKRTTGAAPGQWQPGDVMFANEHDVKGFLQNIDHGKEFLDREFHMYRRSKL